MKDLREHYNIEVKEKEDGSLDIIIEHDERFSEFIRTHFKKKRYTAKLGKKFWKKAVSEMIKDAKKRRGSTMKNFFKLLRLAWKYRKEIKSIKKEIYEVKDSVVEARKDKKITKAEMAKVLKEVEDVLNLIIKILNKE